MSNCNHIKIIFNKIINSRSTCSSFTLPRKIREVRETVNKLLEMAKNKKLHRIVVKEAESFASLRRG
jgi:hypothetical protein